MKDENRNQNQKGNITCFNCVKQGHFAKFCRATKTQLSRKCYSCGKWGHITNQFKIENMKKGSPVTFTATIGSLNENGNVKKKEAVTLIQELHVI